MNVRACLRGGGLLAALLLSFGCSSKAKSPLDPVTGFDTPTGLDASTRFPGFGIRSPRDISGDRFFPLDSGSVWVYSLEQRTTFIDSITPPNSFVDLGSVTTLMRGAYDVGGTPYTLSTETTRIRGDREFEFDVFYRQDATGLYELDAPIRDPASARASRLRDAFAARIARSRPAARSASLRALANLESKISRVERLLHAAGPVPTTGPQGQPEIQRLAYPLSVGREWIVRADPLYTERVEARETIPVAGRRLSAWRIRIESEFFGPDDRVWFWVSPEGELRFRYHLVGAATDIEGNPIGLVIAEEEQQLVQYQLAGGPVVGTPLVPKLPFGGSGMAQREAPRAASTR